MLEFDVSPRIEIDQTERRNGISTVRMAVEVTATESPGVDADAVARRYWFRADLMGFGRNDNPPKRDAEVLTTFGLRVTTMEPMLDPETGDIEMVPVERILERQGLSLRSRPEGHRAIFGGGSSVTVDIDLLNVAEAPSFLFGGREIKFAPHLGADSIFARVEIRDGDNRNAMVASGDSPAISDFFGAGEGDGQGGDDREEPRPPLIFRTIDFGF